ncbi:MAG: zinc-dependent alcohol dehydrogenase [Ardenticatenaceae bacterium]
MKMKAVQIFAPDQAEFVEVPIPELRPSHALIRPIRLSLCASDIFMLRYAPPSSYPLPPGTSGHEMVGVVEAISDEANEAEVAVGDLTLTIAPEQAAMAEYYLAPLHNVLPVPAGVPLEHLVQAQQLGTVIYACKELPNLIGKDVVVIGQGSAGMWHNFMSKRLGAERVIGVDLQAHRLLVSPRYGATHTIHNASVDPVQALKAITGGKLADVVIEAAGTQSSINLAIKLVREYGFMLQFGVPHQPTFPLDYGMMFRKCITLKTIVYASREPRHTSTRMALQMIANGEIDVAPILTHRFPFERVLEAYELQHTRDEGAIKIIIEMPEKS